jgi:hypothetical protein
MHSALLLRDFFWAITTVLEVALLVLLVRKGLYPLYPAFCCYILFAILQSGFVALTYFYVSETSRSAYFFAWGSQAVIVCARWLAVGEIVQNTLSRFHGIWALAQRLLIIVGLTVLFFSMYTSGSRFYLVILTADRAVELCIATIIVGMFVFIRYYRIAISTLERYLAMGFGLYSCFAVINLCIYEKWINVNGPLWTQLDMVTFLASLVLWTTGVLGYAEVTDKEGPSTMTPQIYGELSEKLNSRLQALNDRLDDLFRSRSTRL